MADTEEKKKPSARELERARLHHAQEVNLLRERLYARGNENESGLVRHDVGQDDSVSPVALPPQKTEVKAPQSPRAVEPRGASSTPAYADLPLPHEKKGMRFRTKVLLGGLVLFLLSLAVAAVFFYRGDPVSGSNITVNVDGPLSVGGGDIMTLDVKVQNLNVVPIEFATLIVTYPKGVQSTIDPGRELFTERIQLNNVAPSEEVKVPVRMLVFGEENDAKTVNVSVEYRVKGSNATFKKDALPYEFKIGTSPVILNVNAVKRIPTDQETTIELVVQSNSKEPFSDLLLRASYPQGFDFISATPDTTSGEDVWKLKDLKPGEEQKISIKGRVKGLQDDENEFVFEVGVANAGDPFDIASSLSKRTHVMTIERPFLDVAVKINGSLVEPTVIDASGVANVTIDFTNALDTPIYDGVITVELSGNSLDEMSVRPIDGFYDSRVNTITWDGNDVSDLREIVAGAQNSVSFTVESRGDTRLTPEMKLKVSIAGSRVGEDRVPEQVVGTVSRSIRVASGVKFTSSAVYTEGPFTNSGPVPPVAEETTTYSVLLAVKNGTNPTTATEVTATLPQYVKWSDTTSNDSAVRYNSANRTLRWSVGELKANEYKELWFQVELTPSLSQIGSILNLVGQQRLKATDRFTDESVSATAPELSTSLSGEPNSAYRGGVVQSP